MRSHSGSYVVLFAFGSFENARKEQLKSFPLGRSAEEMHGR
jgi:hypothetical protein